MAPPKQLQANADYTFAGVVVMTALATIHIGLKQLGIVEDDARDLYERLTGERSLRAMRPNQHQTLIEELVRLGFKPVSKGTRKRLTGKYAPKLQALWIAGYNLGLIRNKDDAALLSFVKRQTGIDHTRFLRYQDHASKAIEALKAWLAREGGVDWSNDRFLPDWTQTNGYRIAKAQHAKLCQPGTSHLQPFDQWLALAGFVSPALMTDSAWIDVMNKLGTLIRTTPERDA